MKVACKPDQGKSHLARLTKASQQQAVSSDDHWSEARRKESPCKHGVPFELTPLDRAVIEVDLAAHSVARTPAPGCEANG